MVMAIQQSNSTADKYLEPVAILQGPLLNTQQTFILDMFTLKVDVSL